MNYFYKKMNVRAHFFLRGKEAASSEKRCVIYATIDVDGRKSIPFSTKLKIPAKYWMALEDKKQKIKASTYERPVSSTYTFSENVNEHLIAIQKFAHEAKGILEAMELEVTPDAIKDLIVSPKPIRPVKKLIDVIDELRDDLEELGRAEQTMKNYRTRRNNINSFLEAKKLTKLTISDFRFKHFTQINKWMTQEKTEEGELRWARNTINKHLTMVSQCLNFAVNMEYIQSNPLGLLALEYDASKPPQYLEADARKRIFDCALLSLSRERDVSVFLYSTGLSYTDYLSLGDEHLMRLPAGQWFIKKERDKSSIYSLIPLLPEAQELLTKYGGVAKLPRLDISDFNKALKILGEVCQSPFTLSTSTFRETFSSMMENEYMIPDRLLMFMMGHNNPKQLNNYSNVHPARILHELEKNDIVIPFNLEAFKDLVKAS